jgi:hypothetical protein
MSRVSVVASPALGASLFIFKWNHDLGSCRGGPQEYFDYKRLRTAAHVPALAVPQRSFHPSSWPVTWFSIFRSDQSPFR